MALTYKNFTKMNIDQVEDGAHVFQDMLRYLEENNLPLVGAVQEFTDPGAGKSYLLFPIRRL